MDFKPIAYVLGIMLVILACAMMAPAGLDLLLGSSGWTVFIASGAITLFTGVSLILTSRQSEFTLNIRQAFVMTNAIWIVVAVFGALPFLMESDLKLGLANAFFESMSGITTTGSTVLTGLEHIQPGLLLWRSLLQWLGGIGIVVMALSILPTLQIGGMQLFKTEAFEQNEKILPRAAEIAWAISVLYAGLTIVAGFALWLAGMGLFDAVNHSMTAIATGGFSTHDSSIGHFTNPLIQWIIIVIMIVGSLPFLLYLQAFRRQLLALFKDGQVQVFLVILILSATIMTFWLVNNGIYTSFHDTIRHALFNTTSIMTGTGYSSTDYGQWGSFAFSLMFVIMFIGGCAGSTTCGVKIFRIQILYSTAKTYLKQLIEPNGVFIAHYNGKAIPESVPGSVMAFFFMFVGTFTALALFLGFLGLDFVTAISSAATAVANVGPGLGDIVGPAGTFESLPDAAKWAMSFGMLLGRLELFTVIVLFTADLWRD